MLEEPVSFWCQLKAMLLRNLLIKVRKKKRPIIEILMPLYVLGILVILRAITPNPIFPEVNEPRKEVNIISLFLNMSTFRNLSVAVAPNSTEVKKFIDEMNLTWNKTTNKTDINFITYHSEKHLVNKYRKSPNRFHFGLVFNDSNPLSGPITYKLLVNPTWMKCPDLNENYASEAACREAPYFNATDDHRAESSSSDSSANFQMSDNCPADYYYKSGFTVLQMIIDFTKIRVSQPNRNIILPNVTVNILPKKLFIADWMVRIRLTVPLYMVIAASQFINFLLALIVGEKENKIRQVMKIMGLSDLAYWLSWFLIYFGVVLFYSVASTFTLCYLQVFQHTSYALIFILTLLYSTSIIIISFMITPFFDKAKTAGVLGGFAVTIISMLYFIQVFIDASQPFLLWAVSVISPAAYALAMDKLLTMDLAGSEITFWTIWSDPGFTIGNSFLMMAFDIVLYGFLVFYFDSVWPSEFGTKRHPLFCLPFVMKHENQVDKHSDETNTLKMDNMPNVDVEEVSSDLKTCEAIKIVGLRKTFLSCSQPPVNALCGIDLVIYENEITAILGQNGAGKSTLFNILTGLTSPTSGVAYVYNRDIRDPKSMREIQRMTGVCPQTDILFEDLTVRENVMFFGKIKGLQHELLKSSVDVVLQDLVLEDQADSPTKLLSGGQKRKLSIAIAIVGNPKVIILDEPTAGIDAYSKRQIWTLLHKIKPSKVILLTTHFMEEADIVADRKAILCHGKLRCGGTSLYLKNKFGSGSNLMIEVEDSSRQSIVSQIVRSYVPNAKCTHTFGKEMYFTLPSESMNQFVPLLFFIEKELKSAEKRLSISNYNVFMTSLEQVFLELTRDKLETSATEQYENNIDKCVDDGAVPNEGGTKTSGQNPGNLNTECKPSSLYMTRALLRLRMIQIYREPYHLFYMIILPLLLTSTGFYVHKKSSTESHKNINKTLLLEPGLYSNITHLAMYLEPSVQSKLDSWLSSVDNNTILIPYNGSYSALLHATADPLLGALYVTSCCQPDLLSFTVFYNDTMQHSLPLLLNVLGNTFNRIMTPSLSTNTSDALTLQVEQFPATVLEFNIYTMISAILMGLSFVLLPVSLVSDIIYDRQTKTKHLLHLNGLSRLVYFGVYIIVLGASLLAVSLLLLLLIFYLNISPIDDPKAYWVLALGFACYCPAAILFVTCLSYLFNRFQTAQSLLPTIVSWLGIGTFTTVVVIHSYGTGKVAHFLMSMTNITYMPYAIFYFLNRVVDQCHIQYSCKHLSFTDFFTYEVVILLFGSLAQIPLWSFVLLKVDLKKARRKAKNNVEDSVQLNISSSQHDDEDDDVKIERQRVSELIAEEKLTSPVAIVQNLSKEYKRKEKCCAKFRYKSVCDKTVAVSSLSFAVQRGEVFGLLGHNGAGKTTTIKIIIGEDQPTAGQVWFNGKSDVAGIEDLIGYCPQHDALWQNVTVREHLEIYGAVRGYRSHHLNSVVEQFLKGLLLVDHADKVVQYCSGGTRRKLSFAIAMLGDTSMVLLDEPTSGLDTLSKRFLWNVIRNNFCQGNRGAILTTHSMEEADALCSRVGIMTHGHLKCIGTTQHLKDRYGGGFILEVKLFPSADKLKFQKFVLSTFPDSVLKENVMDRIIFNIPQKSVTSLADVFFLLEQVKSDLGIVMYSFNQTDLEQVFLNLAAPDNSLTNTVATSDSSLTHSTAALDCSLAHSTAAPDSSLAHSMAAPDSSLAHSTAAPDSSLTLPT